MISQDNKKRLIFFIRACVSAAILFYLISIPDWKVLVSLELKSYLNITIGIMLSLIALMIMSLRWRLLLSVHMKANFPYLDAYRGYLMGLFYNIFMPGAIGGDLYRIKHSRDICAISIKNATIVVATERIFGAVALTALLLLGVSLGGSGFILGNTNVEHKYIIVGCFIIVLMALPLIWKKLELRYIDAVKIFLLSLVSQSIELIIAGFILHIMVPEAEIYWILVAMPLAYFATVLPISIGGLGVREGVLVSVFFMFGIAIEDAIIVSILIYIVKVIAGVLGYVLVKMFPGKNTLVKSNV